ncbi:MAG: CRISPR-associated helicase Cas3' [Campylobacteraceae bacterium]|jgi:CRISPR-associated endonuclease/helicase Cas3|nr:CRISPR-associated helicase Cas3' [Campylobacteraceae bacterium]
MGDKNKKRRKNIKYISMLNFNSHPNISINEHIKNMLQNDDEEIELKVKYFHDLAKASVEFQKKLCGEDNKNYSHAIESAVLFFIMNDGEINPDDMITALLAILCHHTRLKDAKQIFKHDDGSEAISSAIDNLGREKTFDNLPAEYFDKFNTLNKNNLSEYMQKQIRKIFRDKKFLLKDVIKQRFLFSNLIFNDKYSVISGERFHFGSPYFNGIFKEHIVNKYLADKPNIRDDFRNSILEKYSANKDKKIFVISAPTGISKTLTSLALAEQIGKKIIFAPPITAIIDQVHDDIKMICADKIEPIKIHHKTFIDIDNDENKERYNKEKFLSETLHGDIVVTTQWQIMSALFSNKNSDCTKIYSLKNSTIIIDEVQSLPYQIINIFEDYIEELSKLYNITFVLMSATMPHFSKDFCILSDDKFFDCYNRYKLEWLKDSRMSKDAIEKNQNILIESIIKSAKKNNKILVVLNQIATAQEIFMILKKSKLKSHKILSLTTYMLEEHRNEVIQYVKNASKNEKIILVSTQSIEAGVDLDFDVGYREIAPVSSIIQTAGRVNRHGLNNDDEIRTLFIFGTISEYTNKIYGDMFVVSRSFLSRLEEQKSIFEKDILNIVKAYFKGLPSNDSRIVEEYISTAAHEKIHKEIFEKYIEVDEFKESLYVADEENEIWCHKILELYQQRYLEKNQNRDKFFEINDMIDCLFKKYIAPNIVKVAKKDICNASSFNKRYCSKIPSSYDNIYVMNKEYYNKDVGIAKKNVMEKFQDDVTDISVS